MKRHTWISSILLGATILALQSCVESQTVFDPYVQFQKEVSAIESYLANNNNGDLIIRDSIGVFLRIQTVGDRLPPGLANSTVVTSYVGTLFPDGTVFDQSSSYTTLLSQVIGGWTRGFLLLPQGSEADIFIPSYYGYGQYGKGSIPGNTTLQFHVVLKQVKYSTTEQTQLAKDITAIDQYIANNSIEGVQIDSSGVRYVITQTGDGPTPTWYDRIGVSFKIATLKGGVVGTFRDFKTGDKISDFGRERVIDYINGMKAILLKMNVGSKATLYIPSTLAYGNYGFTDPVPPDTANPFTIGADTNVVVELELIDIQ